MGIEVNRTLECEGLACPLPVVRTKKTIDEMNSGEVLEIRATDKGSVADLQGWAKRTGHQYIGLKEENGVFRHFIRKAEASNVKAEIKYPHVISNDELQATLSGGEAIQVIDVREPAEYAFGHISGAVSIPLGDLERQIGELNPERAYAVVCRTGNRSDLACQMLSDKGFNHLKNVMPGMSAWTGELEKSV